MNILIRDTNLLAMTGDVKVEEHVNIGIENDRITFVGDVPFDFEADEIIDGKNKITMPGLINAHTHIAMSLFRNYAEDMAFWPWLTEKILPLETNLKGEYVYWGSMLSITEMIRSGITSFSDMYFYMEEVAKAVKETGIRANLCMCITTSIDEDLKIKEAAELYNNWHGKCDGRIKITSGPHAVYSCNDTTLNKIINDAKKYDKEIHIHVSETLKEVEDCMESYGKSPVEYLNDLGLFDIKTSIAHGVHLSSKDIQILKDKNVSVINNPGSNMKLGNGFAPVKEIIDAGVNICLGTDGSASNNNLNLFEEINLAGVINKGVNKDATVVSSIQALKMATVNGAKALGIEKEVGTIEVGKKADIILIDLNKPHFFPRYNMVAALVYSAQASDVETVIIDGRIIMQNYIMKDIDETKVFENAQLQAENLINS